MALTGILPLLGVSLLAFSGVAHASDLVVAVSGQFSNPAGDQASTLWAPNATWSLSFDVNSSPAVTNTTTLGFDVPVSQFTYKLNGATVSDAPTNITFSTAGNGGLFTLYFGSESGYVNGMPIPEFSFEGAQVFGGSTASPTFSAGTFATTSLLYTDAVNLDMGASTSAVTLTPTPEPSSALLLVLPFFALALPRVRRFLAGQLNA